MLDGLYEAHLEVADLERAREFYEDVLELELGHLDDRGVAFYRMGARFRTMLGVWEVAAPTGGHVAFRMDDADGLLDFLAARGLEPTRAFSLPADAPVVHPWLPAAAVYFADPDGNELELLAELDDDPRPDRAPMSLPDWRALVAGSSE